MTQTTSNTQQLEQKVQQLEQALLNANSVQSMQGNMMAMNRHQADDDEIDLIELWNVIWSSKKIIIFTTVLFTIIAIFYALAQPNQYKSTVVLAPVESEGGGLGGLAAQYGGLAAMAGINLGGGGGNQVDQALEIATSWPFIETFINKYTLAPKILAVDQWNLESGKLTFDNDIYNAETNKWLVEEKGHSSWKSYKAFKTMLSISQDKKTSFINITIETISPILSHRWAELLVKELNQHFQYLAIKQSQKNIDFLNNKILETSVAEMRSVFYALIEEQTKTLMLASLNEEYLLKTVIPAKVAEEKSKPKRSLIVVLGCLLGGMLSVMLVLVLHFKNPEDDGKD